jgi:hypothetical protein
VFFERFAHREEDASFYSDQNVDDFWANVDEEARRRRQKSSRVFEVSLRRARM